MFAFMKKSGHVQDLNLDGSHTSIQSVVVGSILPPTPLPLQPCPSSVRCPISPIRHSRNDAQHRSECPYLPMRDVGRKLSSTNRKDIDEGGKNHARYVAKTTPTVQLTIAAPINTTRVREETTA
ncbi:hypothetical protein GALMADRAFT_729075, partial [Galerina marginata CBS 339.88]